MVTRSIVKRLGTSLLIAMFAAGCVLQSAAPTAAPPAPTAVPAPPKPAATTAPAAPAPTAAAAKPAAPAPTTAPVAAAKPAIPTTPVEIVFWNITMPGQPEIVADRVKEYTAAHPNVKIQVDNLAYSDLQKKLLVAIGTGTGPDLSLVNSGWMPTYVEKSNFVPVSPQSLGFASIEAMKQAYIPAAIDAITYDGKLVAVPYYWNVFNFYINTEHFKAAGLDPEKDYPKTWDDVMAVAKKLTKTEGGKITRQGYRFSMISNSWSQIAFEPLLFQLGGNTIGPDGKCAMNSPAGVKAMSTLQSFVREKVMDPNVSVATVPVPVMDFAKEVTSMHSGHPLTISFVKQNNPALYDRKGFKVTPLPQFDPNKPVTIMNGQTWAVNAASSPEKIAVAQDFIRTLIARPQEWLVRVGAISPLNALLDTPEGKAIPYLDVILDSMKSGKHVTLSKFGPEIVDAEHRALQAVVLNNADPKQALDTACQEVNRALGR